MLDCMGAVFYTRGMRIQFVTMLAIALSVFIVASCLERADKEREPNNQFTDANALTSRMRGELIYDAKTKDIDTFVIQVEEDALYDISVHPRRASDLAWEIYRNDRERLKTINTLEHETASDAEIMRNLLLRRGSYYLRIRFGEHGAADTPYTIRVEKKAPLGAFEHEPNDTLAQATEIKGNDRREGYYLPNLNYQHSKKSDGFLGYEYVEFDCFHIPFAGGGAKALAIEISSVPEIDAALRVYNARGEFLFEKNAGGEGESEAIDNLRFADDCYLALYARNMRANAKIPYRLRVRESACLPHREYEPNNIEAEALRITSGEGYAGSIDYEGDTDIFAYYPEGANGFSVLLAATRLTPLRVLVFDVSGETHVLETVSVKEEKTFYLTNTHARHKYYISVSWTEGGQGSADADITEGSDYRLRVMPD